MSNFVANMTIQKINGKVQRKKLFWVDDVFSSFIFIF